MRNNFKAFVNRSYIYYRRDKHKEAINVSTCLFISFTDRGGVCKEKENMDQHSGKTR